MSAPQLTQYVQGSTVLSADGLNTMQQTCDNFAQLRGLVGVPGMQVYPRGRYSANDGYAGTFYWNASLSGATDDNTNTILPPGYTLGGWVRINSIIGNLVAASTAGAPTVPTVTAFQGEIAIGDGATVTGTGTGQMAIGTSSVTSGAGVNTIAIGKTFASGNYAFAVQGQDNTGNYGAQGVAAIAMGQQAKAAATNAIAIGANATATSTNAIAIGTTTSATAPYAIVVGTTATGSGSYCVVMGGAGQTASGNYAGAFAGQSGAASGTNSVIIGGTQNTASGTNTAVLGGTTNTASSTGAVAIGGGSNIASGPYSQASGFGSIAPGYGQQVWSSAYRATAGDTQASRYTLQGTASSVTPFNMTIDGTHEISVATSTAVAYQAILVGRDAATGSSKGCAIQTLLPGLVINSGGTLSHTAATWATGQYLGGMTGVLISGSVTGTTLRFQVTSIATDTVNYTLRVDTSEVL